RECLRNLSRATDTSVSYAGSEQREAFAHWLAEDSAIPPEILRFALLTSSAQRGPGASRNCILLQTLGSAILSSDDDIVCSPATVPGTQSSGGAVFEGHQNPAEFWCFADQLHALQFGKPVE